jgi:hypothetical protein
MNLKFSPEKQTLIFSVSNHEIRSIITNYATSNGYLSKKEYHVTIVGFPLGQEIKKQIDSGTIFLNDIQVLAQKFDFAFDFLEEFYIIEKKYKDHTRYSIIQKAYSIELINFYKILNELLGMEIDQPFPHLTLFTKGDKDQKFPGIGINSEQDFLKHVQGKLNT